jgi:hypothetical protein
MAAAGGLAGRGGNVVVSTQDPKLLILVECDVRAGWGGRGGLGGIAGTGGSKGKGGQRGLGGCGGAGGPAIYETVSDYSSDGRYIGSHQRLVRGAGSPGFSGPNGRAGSDGRNGSPGTAMSNFNNLTDAPEGSVTYVILDSNGAVVQEASERFNLTVLQFFLRDENCDGIFEPDSDVFLEQITILNNGGLTCPEGSMLFAPTTMTAHQAHEPVVVPAIASSKLFIACSTGDGLRMHIPSVPGPCVGKPFSSVARIAPAITLCDRLFDEASPSVFVTVQYPLRIVATRAPTFMAPTEFCVFTVEMMNISMVPYGFNVGSTHSAHLLFKVDRNMEIIHLPSEVAKVFVFPDGLAAKADFHLILPNTTVAVSFQVRMRESAGNLLYVHLPWDATLFLREKPIEIRSGELRVTPCYNDNKVTDMVIVTAKTTTREEFLAWSYLIQTLGLSAGFWDYERYRGVRCCLDTGPASAQVPTPVSGILPKFHLPPASILAQMTPLELKALANRIGLPENATNDGAEVFANVAGETDFVYFGRHWLHRCRTLVTPRWGDVHQGGVDIQLFVPADIEQHIHGLTHQDRAAWRTHLRSLVSPASSSEMDSIEEYYLSPHHSKAMLTLGWDTKSTAPILFNHAAVLPDEKNFLDMEAWHCCLPLWLGCVTEMIQEDKVKKMMGNGSNSCAPMCNVCLQRLFLGCADSKRRYLELGYCSQCNNNCRIACVEPCGICCAFQCDDETSYTAKGCRCHPCCPNKSESRIQLETFPLPQPKAVGCSGMKSCRCFNVIVGKMIVHKASIRRTDNYMNIKNEHILMSSMPELLPYRYFAEEGVADSRVGMFHSIEVPVPLQSPYIQTLIGLVAVQPALTVLCYMTGSGMCPSLMTKLRIAFNAPTATGVFGFCCETCCCAPRTPTPIVLTHVDIGFAVLVSFIMRELADDAVLNTTANVIAVFAESQSSIVSLYDVVNFCCVIRRVLYELGRVGGLFGGSSLAGFPWCFTRASRVAAELRAIEARTLKVARAVCVTDAHRKFLSDSLAVVWARPLLADLLFIKRVDSLFPANDERKPGDYSDTVSTRDVQQLLQSRNLRRPQPPQATNTMASAPPLTALDDKASSSTYSLHCTALS